MGGETYVKPQMKSAFLRHKLYRNVLEIPYSVWVMKRPHSRVFLVQLTFTPEGIAIQGDVGLGPGQHGLCSRLGCTLPWFSSDKSEDYLCSKFLHQVFVPQYASKGIKDAVETDPEAFSKGQKQDLLNLARDLAQDPGYPEVRLYDELSFMEYDLDDGLPGYGYDPSDAGWLCAIQQWFVQLRKDWE